MIRLLVGLFAAVAIIAVVVWGLSLAMLQAAAQGNWPGLLLLLVIFCIPLAVWGLSADD